MIDKLFLMIKNFRREVTDSSFTDAYENYLSRRIRRLKGKEDNHLEEGKNLLNILKEKQGLTQEELDHYLDNYSAFEEFWNDEGYDLCLDMPNYNSYKPTIKEGMSLSDVSQQSDRTLKERKKVRDNMLIDMISKGLRTPAGSQMSMIPGSYYDIKHASRVQQIAKDPIALDAFMKQHKEEIAKNGLYKTLNEYGRKNTLSTTSDSTSALEKFHESNASIEDPLSIVDYSNNHRNLMDGNDLIGIFAISSSSHYKFQFINNGNGLSIAKEYQFNVSIDGKNTIKADRIDSVVSPFTGAKIGDYCAQYQAASPDNGKDPVLGDINANTKTTKRIEFLTRIGLDPDSVGVLNTCDVFLTDIRSIKSIPNSGFDDAYFDWKRFHGSIPRIFELKSKYTLNGFENFSEEELKECMQFLGWMDNINKLSKLLNKSSCIARCDSPNGALGVNTAVVTQQMMKAKDFIDEVTIRRNGKLMANPTSPIQGFEQFIDTELDAINTDDIRSRILNSAVPRVQAAYTLGIKSAYTLVSKFNLLPQLSSVVRDSILYLSNVTGKKLTSSRETAEIRQFYNELVMYLLSGEDSRFGTTKDNDIMDKRNYYIHDFPMKYKIFMNEKDSKGKYKHERVRNMTIFKCVRVSEKTGITFQNVNNVSQTVRKYLSEELDQLLASTDPEEVQFAEDLFNYAYYANGINFGPNNYGIFFSNLYYERMPKYLDTLKRRNSQLAISDGMDSYLQNFVYQFLANNPQFAKRLFSTDKLFDFKKDNETGQIIMQFKLGMDTKQKNKALDKVATLDGRSTVPIIIVNDKYYGGMYYRVSRAVDEPVFVKIRYNGLSTPFYDSSKKVTEIDYKQLKGYGNPSNINKVMEIMEKENKKNNEDDSKVEKQIPTTSESEDIKDLEVSDAASNLDAIESNEDEPSNLDAPVEDGVDEEELSEKADFWTKQDEKQQEYEKKLQALSDIVSKLEEESNLDEYKDDDLVESDNNLCEH